MPDKKKTSFSFKRAPKKPTKFVAIRGFDKEKGVAADGKDFIKGLDKKRGIQPVVAKKKVRRTMTIPLCRNPWDKKAKVVAKTSDQAAADALLREASGERSNCLCPGRHTAAAAVRVNGGPNHAPLI